MLKFDMDFSEIEEFAERLGDADMFEEMLKDIVEKMASDLLDILISNTPVKTGKLLFGWTDHSEIPSKITKVSGGYTVEIGNDVEYAYYVNYGHHSYNQYGGPYIVKDENRTVMYTRGESGATFVYGMFFLEDSILEFTNGTNNIQNIIKKELNEWWEWCFSG
jgi:uncharacterized protein (DUF1330 family)